MKTDTHTLYKNYWPRKQKVQSEDQEGIAFAKSPLTWLSPVTAWRRRTYAENLFAPPESLFTPPHPVFCLKLFCPLASNCISQQEAWEEIKVRKECDVAVFSFSLITLSSIASNCVFSNFHDKPCYSVNIAFTTFPPLTILMEKSNSSYTEDHCDFKLLY